MLDIINNKNLLLSDSANFELVRTSIKKESDSIEVYTLKEKL